MDKLAAQPLAAFVFGLLLIQLFAPLAAAQTPTPAPAATARASPAPTAAPAPLPTGGACTLSQMTTDEVKQWWRAFGETGFQAEELNNLPDNKLAANKPGNITVNVNVFGGGQSAGYANLTEVAAILGMNPRDAAKALGATDADGTVVTYSQAAALAGISGKPVNQLDRLFGRTIGTVSVPTQPWEGYKVRMPSGKDVALKDLYNLYPIGADECLLDAQDIQGRVEYVALLNKDLTYGYLRSATTTGGSQHFSASEADAALNLNGGANILIPSQFESWLGFVKEVNFYDMWLSLGAGVLAFKNAAAAKEEADKIAKKLSPELQELRQSSLHLNLQRQDTFVKGIIEETRDPAVAKNLFDPASAAAFAGPGGDVAAVNIVKDLANRLKSLPTNLDDAVAKKAADALRGKDLGTHFGNALSHAQATAIGPNAVTLRTRVLELAQASNTRALTTQEAAELVTKYRDLGAALSAPPVGVAPVALADLHALDPSLAPLAGDVAAVAKNADELAVFNKISGGQPVTKTELDRIGINTHTMAPNGNLRDPGDMRQVLETNKQIKNSENTIKDLETRQKELGEQAKSLDELYRGARKRLQTSLMVGGLWLGPARFAFSINSAILFQLRASQTEDKYVTLFINKPDIAGEFRRATNTLGSGTLLELAGDALGSGTPAKAFTVGEVLLFNRAQETTDASRTALVGGAIATSWKGRSETTNFEDIRGVQANEFTSLALESNLIPPDAVIERRSEFETYTYALGFLVPLIVTRSLRDIPSTLYTLVPFLAVNDYIMQIDPREFSKEACDASTVSEYKTAYTAATAAGLVTSYFPAIGVANAYKVALKGFVPLMQTSKVGKFFGKALNVVDFLNLPIAFQWYIGNRALSYVSSCKDQKYKILSYQQLAAPKGDLTSKLAPAGTLGKGLNVGDLFKGVGQKVDLATFPEVLNLRALLRDQYGYVKPRELYYFHLDGGNAQWHGAFARRPECFKTNLQSRDGTAVTLNNQGIVVKDKNGVEKLSLKGADWSRRALLSQLRQDLARQIVPNRLISTVLDCTPPEATAFEVTDRSRLLARAPSCFGVTCVQSKLEELTGRRIGEDLSNALGPVQRVYTSEGVATLEEGFARFLRTTPKGDEPAGMEVQAPSIQTLEAAAPRQPSSLLVRGDGKVVLRGQYRGASVEELEIGDLHTLITQNGRLEFNPANKELHVALYVVTEVRAEPVKGIGTGARTERDGTPSILIQNLQPVTPGDPAVRELEQAVKKLQQDGGFQQFDTKNKTYAFGTDEAGNPVLKIVDKVTGKVDTVKITGPVTHDPVTGEVRVPTERGEFKFKIDMQNGQPTLTVTDPNGLRDIAALLAARAPGGILVFDPQTGKWQLLNGQDIPLNPDFASKGLSLLGSPDGARGVARDSLLSQPRRPGRETAGLGAFAALPSWPEHPLALAAMLAALLAGVLFVRSRVRPTD